MKIRFLALATTLLAITAAVGAAEKRNAGPEVLVTASALKEVPEGLRPTPGKPIYYILGKAQVSLGETVAGIKMPEPAAVERAVVAALASQGFVRTEVGGPVPAIYVIATWGDANFLPVDDADPGVDPELQRAMNLTRPTTRDRPMIENLVGTQRMSSLSPSDMQKVAAASNEDRLFVSLAALDIAELRRKNKKLLWRTSMTIDGRLKLADALPAMLASAAPYFGRDATAPVFIDDLDRRETNVEIGEMKVVREDEPTPVDPKKKK